MASLTLEQLSKTYGPPGSGAAPAVRALDMAVDDGEIVALLGSSGCGKTSTLRMIAGFETVSAGAIRIGGRSVHPLRPAERGVAMAFEGYALYPPLTVADNIGFALLRCKMPRAQVRQRVQQVAELLEIAGLLDLYPATLSGGQQQRVSLARALARPAELYLLDEPMSQLEPQLRAVLRGRIRQHLAARGMTSILVTHDQTEAMALSDRIAVMSHGVLQQLACPDQLQARPANLFVAGFVGEPAMNLLPARLQVEHGRLQAVVSACQGGDAVLHADFGPMVRASALATAALRPGQAVHLGVRPQLVRLLAPGQADPAAPGKGCTAHATLAFNQWLGDQSHLGFDAGGHRLLAVADGATSLATGQTARLSLPTAALHLFDSDSEQALLHGADLG